ncbi:hypothetical protein C0989_003200 [Termitomyces sp. Mn162]|nr:hypothetical protein C0989_003200 [Termitomyces sp. Mn162]
MKISVEEKYRGKAIGSFTLKFVTSEHVNKRHDTVMCWPTPELREVTGDIKWKKLKEKQVAFFRKNGFRRVGRTGIFGYSPKATHPSRSIPVTHDAQEKGKDFGTLDIDLSTDEIRKKYPLHTAIFHKKKGEIGVIGTIRKHYQLDPTSIHQPNSLGYTPIHLALMTANPEAVRVLLELGVTEDLHNSSNVQCRTPLEVLESMMMLSRQVASGPGGHWKGYNDNELTCEFLVKRAMGKSIMADTLAEYIAKRKWGCTCGACAGGWLSKSMRSKLSLVTYESLDVSHSFQLETFQSRVQHPNPDALMLIRDFPPELRRSVFLTFYAGCQSIFEAVLKFLDETDEPLSVVAILACTSNDTSVKPFFTEGGRIEHVLNSITRWAMSRVLRGDDMGFEYEWLDEKKGKNEVLCE